RLGLAGCLWRAVGLGFLTGFCLAELLWLSGVLEVVLLFQGMFPSLLRPGRLRLRAGELIGMFRRLGNRLIFHRHQSSEVSFMLFWGWCKLFSSRPKPRQLFKLRCRRPWRHQQQLIRRGWQIWSVLTEPL